MKKEHKDYLYEKIADFQNLITKDLYSVIINRDHEIEICTNKSAKSVGVDSWEQIKGVSFTDYDDQSLLQQYFQEAYSSELKDEIKRYVQQLAYLQKKVINESIVVQFIDMLPYDNKFITYITTYTPIVHSDGTVVGIQSFSVQSYALRFQGHIYPPVQDYPAELERFTNREREILFLLSNGATQDRISQILNISRGTTASIISNQLCPKFNIAGANTRLLMEAAIKSGMYKYIPKSLWKPCLIVLNHDLYESFPDDDV